MTPTPSFACVIPTHNRHEFLRESLTSVLLQSLPPQEVIVVSDVPDRGSVLLVATELGTEPVG